MTSLTPQHVFPGLAGEQALSETCWRPNSEAVESAR